METKSDHRQDNFIIFKVTVTAKGSKEVVKAIAQFFNSQITDACSVQSADIFVVLSSVLLQNSFRYLKKHRDYQYHW